MVITWYCVMVSSDSCKIAFWNVFPHNKGFSTVHLGLHSKFVIMVCNCIFDVFFLSLWFEYLLYFHYYSIIKRAHFNSYIETIMRFKICNCVFNIASFIETMLIGKYSISQGSRNQVHYIVVHIIRVSHQFLLEDEHSIS